MKFVKLRRRWYQFSLRTMFVGMTLACVVLAWVGYSLNWIRQRHAAVANGQVIIVDRGTLPGMVTAPAPHVTAPGGLWLFGEAGVAMLTTPSGVKSESMQRLFPEAAMSDIVRAASGLCTGMTMKEAFEAIKKTGETVEPQGINEAYNLYVAIGKAPHSMKCALLFYPTNEVRDVIGMKKDSEGYPLEVWGFGLVAMIRVMDDGVVIPSAESQGIYVWPKSVAGMRYTGILREPNTGGKSE